MEILMAFLLIPVLFLVGVVVASLPLYVTLKFFSVDNNTLMQALITTVSAWFVSLVVGVALGIVGMVIPVIPHLLAGIAPFAVYVWLVQKFYALNLIESIIVSVVQMVVAVLMVLGFIFGILLPLGIGAGLMAI
ncbi:MAG: hypothetical protein IGS03_19215 [Candidatus Sericytochromatia bacterium]|nr:hypothetical protein [Candidatus Sericytochromatia bacterium]